LRTGREESPPVTPNREVATRAARSVSVTDDTFFLNGVNGRTGEYFAESLNSAAILERFDAKVAVKLLQRRTEQKEGVLGLPPGSRAENVTEAGWALVLHEEDEDLAAELEPLIDHRRTEIGPKLTHCLTYSGEPRAKWLARYGVAAGEIAPTKVPYYLLFAGRSSRFPFRVMHELAVDYAVGRIEFDDRADYRKYAENVVGHEKASPPPRRRFEVFAPRHDSATSLSADHLAKPLSAPDSAVAAAGFAPRRSIGKDATKARLAEIFGKADELPAVLFTASHGIEWPAGDELQTAKQGAILCQDWTGGPPSERHYFAASDVPHETNLRGLITFHFACFSAGTPSASRFDFLSNGQALALAPDDFIAALPKELLRRGALASVGHVERAWGFSIAPPDAGAQIGPFRHFLQYVVRGYPVGFAVKDFRERYAALSVSLLNRQLEANTKVVPKPLLAALLTERNDAEAYLVVGDPAARLTVAQ